MPPPDRPAGAPLPPPVAVRVPTKGAAASLASLAARIGQAARLSAVTALFDSAGAPVRKLEEAAAGGVVLFTAPGEPAPPRRKAPYRGLRAASAMPAAAGHAHAHTHGYGHAHGHGEGLGHDHRHGHGLRGDGFREASPRPSAPLGFASDSWSEGDDAGSVGDSDDDFDWDELLMANGGAAASAGAHAANVSAGSAAARTSPPRPGMVRMHGATCWICLQPCRPSFAAACARGVLC